MSELDYSPLGGASRPQEGRSRIVRASIDALNSHEFQKMNRILEQDYTQKQPTILDQPLGVVINNTANFFGNSVSLYQDKLIEAEFTHKLHSGNSSMRNSLQTHLLAMSLFIRDNDNILYLGILLVILSVLMTFFNLSRGYGSSETVTKS